MSVPRILVVDDEESIRKVVGYALTQEGYEVHTESDPVVAEALFARLAPALVILDVMLPNKSGLDVVRTLRAHSDVPIVMLSARADEVDRILGLELGADDYVAKPFSPRELVSRVKAILRRADAASAHRERIEIGALRIDMASREVWLGDEPIPLTRTEFDILLHLARRPGTAFSRESILASLWEHSHIGDARAIDVHIHNIREKLEHDPKQPEWVLTVRGFGYRVRGPQDFTEP